MKSRLQVPNKTNDQPIDSYDVGRSNKLGYFWVCPVADRLWGSGLYLPSAISQRKPSSKLLTPFEVRTSKEKHNVVVAYISQAASLGNAKK